MYYPEACERLGLQVDVELTDTDLKKAFKRAALKHHPDKNLANPEEAKETFQLISTAYDFLSQCVARGQTGPHQPRFATSDNPHFEAADEYYYDDDEDNSEEDDYVDLQEMLYARLFARFAARNQYGGRGGGGVGGMGVPIFVQEEDGTVYGFGFGPGIFGGGGGGGYRHHHQQHHHGSSSYHSSYHATSSSVDDDDDDDDLEDMFERMAEQQRRKEEARRQARAKQEEHAKYMAERARQAELEGRDFFESWSIKQLLGECQRRGIPTKGLNKQQTIIDVLIQDETKKRLRAELKEEAPLLDEWAVVMDHPKHVEWNGMKVRVIDFFDDKYTIEWDANAGKKKKKGDIGRESRKARIKPEHLRLWGAGDNVPSSTANAGASVNGSDKENNDNQKQKGGKKSEKNKSNNQSAATATATASATTKAPEETPSKPKATPKAPPSPPPEVPKTKCCAICHKEHDIATGTENAKTKTVILPCAHIFCVDCCGGTYIPPNATNSAVEIRSCRVCHKKDPTVDAIAALPYVQALKDPSPALLEALYNEYAMTAKCDNIDALEKQQEKELTALEAQKTKALKEKKDAITAKLDSNKTNNSNNKNKGKNNKAKEAPDQKGKLIKQAQASVEAEFEPKRAELMRKHETLWRSVAKKGSTKQMQQEREAATEAVTKAINKHYRRASIKCHPDRHGPECQAEFDSLTKAKDTLSDVDLRRKYMEQMLEIVQSVGTAWLPASHLTWVDKYQPDVAEQNPTTKKKKSDATGNQAPLAIEGGLMHTKPRKPGVAILNLGERRIRVSLRVPSGSWYEFNSYCQAVSVMGERADVSSAQMEEFTKTIVRENFKKKYDYDGIEVDLTLPQPGLWNIRWMQTIELEPGITTNSSQSADATVDLVSPKYKAQMKIMQTFEDVAKRRTCELLAAIRKLDNTAGSHSNAQSRYETLQEAILKAKHTEYHLTKAMKTVGANLETPDTPLSRLRSAIVQTRPYKKELDSALEELEKRVAKKNFKQEVYDILETGEGSSWVAVVAKETLIEELKGDANRLYQLLMEGKKAYNLDLVDAATLFAASDRSDLFSAKQLRALGDRSEEVEITAGREAANEAAEMGKLEADLKERLAMESQAAQAALMDLERGVTVQIKGLKSERTLNGCLAIYMGIAGNSGRFILRILNEEREIAIKKQNFQKFNGLGDASFGGKEKGQSWSCSSCTYRHEGYNVGEMMACSVCGTMRDATKKGETKNSTIESNEKAASTSGESRGKGKTPQPDAAATTTQKKPTVVSSTSASFVSPSPKQEATAEEQKATAMPTSSDPQMMNGSATKYHHQQNGAHQKSPSRVQHSSNSHPVVTTPGSFANTAYECNDTPEKVKKRCKHGKKCKFGTQCKFLHSAEEIAFIMGKVPGSTPKTPESKESPATPTTATDSLTTSPQRGTETAADLTPSLSSEAMERTMWVDANPKAVRFVFGQHGQIVRDFVKRSKAFQITFGTDMEGKRPVHITGPTQQSVDKAVSLIQNRVDKFDPEHTNRNTKSRVPTTSESISSISTVPSVINGSQQRSPTGTMATTTNNQEGGLQAFVQSQAKALKCPPNQFLKWLQGEDILTLEDLIDACEDADFLEELFENGLKKFKMAAFRKSAAAVAGGGN